MSSTFLQEYNFLRNILQFYINLLDKAPSGNNGGNLITPVQFNAEARAVDNVLLDIEGIVAYIYYNVFNVAMPSLSGGVTSTEANNIISIYDALGAARPSLNFI
jgi:hypothetical protein